MSIYFYRKTIKIYRIKNTRRFHCLVLSFSLILARNEGIYNDEQRKKTGLDCFFLNTGEVLSAPMARKMATTRSAIREKGTEL